MMPFVLQRLSLGALAPWGAAPVLGPGSGEALRSLVPRARSALVPEIGAALTPPVGPTLTAGQDVLSGNGLGAADASAFVALLARARASGLSESIGDLLRNQEDSTDGEGNPLAASTPISTGNTWVAGQEPELGGLLIRNRGICLPEQRL